MHKTAKIRRKLRKNVRTIEAHLLTYFIVIISVISLGLGVVFFHTVENVTKKDEVAKVKLIGKQVLRMLDIHFSVADGTSIDFSDDVKLYRGLTSVQALSEGAKAKYARRANKQDVEFIVLNTNGEMVETISSYRVPFDAVWVKSELKSLITNESNYYLVTQNGVMHWVVVRPIERETIAGYLLVSKRIDSDLHAQINNVFPQDMSFQFFKNDILKIKSFSSLEMEILSYDSEERYSDTVFSIMTKEGRTAPFRLYLQYEHDDAMRRVLMVSFWFALGFVVLSLAGFMLFLRKKLVYPIRVVNNWLSRHLYSVEDIEPLNYDGYEEVKQVGVNIYRICMKFAHTNAQSKQILESISDYVFRVDDRGVVAYCSPSCERWLGVPYTQIVGQPIDFLIQIASGEAVDSWLHMVFHSGSSYESDVAFSTVFERNIKIWSHVTVSKIPNANLATLIIRRV
ncbi:PAS domain-containing protein [Vibrio paucivorans]|uniref:PAS domain-containing protein n=1 Tax=Vibrio paucivorans TaxID=2829489 RepID=A0A9X3HSW4_9VIBR|nr:PAS domain-containing protein [Vibrio paucivorans]MCW8335141.1 hypothetical protein [Vibrio paucivorans]